MARQQNPANNEPAALPTEGPGALRLGPLFQSISEALTLAVFLIGISVILGWLFDITFLKSVFPGSVTMKVNTALSFILLSASLWMLQKKRAHNPVFRFTARLCASAAILIGAVVLVEYITGWDLGIDQLLIKEGPGAAFTTHLGRPSPLTVLDLALVGVAILLIDMRAWRGIQPGTALLTFVGLTSLLAFLSHLFGVPHIFKFIPGSTAIALNTAVTFLALTAAILLARPERGPAAILASETAGGVLLRRMLLPMVIAMVVLDYAVDSAEKAGFYDSRSETILHNTLLIALFTSIVFMTAKLLRDTDVEKNLAEMKLLEGEKRYRQMFHATKAVCLLIDPETSKIVDANDSACAYYGYRKDELLSKSITEINVLSHGEINTALDEAKTGKRSYFSFRHRLSSGEVREVESYPSPVTIGGKTLIYSIIHDINERKKAEDALKESETRFREIFQQITDYILVLEPMPGGPPIIIDASDSGMEKHGYSREELIGKPITFLSADASKVPGRTNALMAEKELRFESTHRRKDGSTFTADVSTKMITVGGKTLIFSVERDITDRKAAEERLKAAKEVAEAATLMKDKFVSLVSHDLKSPLSSMVGFLKLVLDDNSAQLNEGAKLILNNAIISGKQMARLIDDLLNVSRIRTGALKLNRQFFDAKYLGAMMAANYSYLAGQKGIEIENTIPDNSRVYADKTLLAEAIQNLITNAIKFCARGDKITISFEEGDPLTIRVSDTGPGIQPEKLADLFNYSKKTSTPGTAGEPGTGLGLPLVKDIMELHGANWR